MEQLDIKEEPGRREADGSFLPGSTTSESAAAYLAGEMACMANTPGGGALIVGIADDGTRIGTNLDAEWLRHRIWELTSRKLTIAARADGLNGCRVLVLTCAEALEPVDYRGRLRWRVGANCVEVDPVVWRARMLERIGYDWSDQPSGHVAADASPAAIEVARGYLREASASTSGDDLADASDADLLRRLNLVRDDQRLTNAGSLLFVKTPWPAIDYMRRDQPGGDSTLRIEESSPLLVQVNKAEQAAAAANRVTHTTGGFALRKIRALPPKTVREAIVNGVIHRDWLSPLPTVVEHIGDTLAVTSPGGFLGGVTPDNIITHPAVPRYRSLAGAVAALGLAEREGIGVDRMVRDMLAIGRPAPAISEINGPYVRIALVGGPPDVAIVELAEALNSQSAATVDSLLLIEHLAQNGWADTASAAPMLQRSSQTEVEEAIHRLGEVHLDTGSDPAGHGTPRPQTAPAVIAAVRGTPADHPRAYRLSDTARSMLAHRLAHLNTPEGREAMILRWSRTRGRVSTSEAADLTGLSKTSAGKLLTRLAETGHLAPGRPNRTGRGFYYTPTNN